MRNRVQGVVHQIRPVIDRRDAHTGWQAAPVQVVHGGFDRLQDFRRVFAAAHQDDSFNASRLVINAEDPGLWRTGNVHAADVFHKHRNSLELRNNNALDVGGILDQPDAADHHRLLLVIKHGSARVAVVGANRLGNLRN